MRFSYVRGLSTMCSIFPFQSDLLGCSFSIQGLFNKIPVLFLQIQGKLKSFSKSFQGPSSFSKSIPGQCEPWTAFPWFISTPQYCTLLNMQICDVLSVVVIPGIGKLCGQIAPLTSPSVRQGTACSLIIRFQTSFMVNAADVKLVLN